MLPVGPAHRVRGHVVPLTTPQAASRRVRHAARKRRLRVMQLLGGRATYKPVRLLVHRREQLAVYQVAQRQACHMRHRLHSGRRATCATAW